MDHKNLQEEIEEFYFYVLCERKPDGFYMVGYFSKQKQPQGQLNLSCIMVLPSSQRSGYGKFLIDFSYSLSLIEKKQGTPERPLSDLGHRTYVSYWTHIILNLLLEDKSSSLSVMDIAKRTGIMAPDIVYVLENYEILRNNNGKYYMYTEPEYLKKIMEKYGRKFRAV